MKVKAIFLLEKVKCIFILLLLITTYTHTCIISLRLNWNDVLSLILNRPQKDTTSINDSNLKIQKMSEYGHEMQPSQIQLLAP